jgi:hypothetical protein
MRACAGADEDVVLNVPERDAKATVRRQKSKKPRKRVSLAGGEDVPQAGKNAAPAQRRPTANQFVKYVEHEQYEKFETEEDLQAILSIAGLQKVDYACMRPHLERYLRQARRDLAPKLVEWNNEYAAWKTEKEEWQMRRRALLLLHPEKRKVVDRDEFRPPPWKPRGEFLPEVQECVAMIKLAMKEQHDAWAAKQFSAAGERRVSKKLSRADAGVMVSASLGRVAAAPAQTTRSGRFASVLIPVEEVPGPTLTLPPPV